jgi:hypothetical protein
MRPKNNCQLSIVNCQLNALLLFLILAFSACNFFAEKSEPEQALAGDAVVVVFSKDGGWMLEFMQSDFPLFSGKNICPIFANSD